MFDIAFDNPWVLLALALVPLAAWFIWRPRNRVGSFRYPDVQTLRRMGWGLPTHLARIPDALRLIAIATLIVAAARPQTADTEILSGEGVDIMVALDMSASMNAVDMTKDEIEDAVRRDQIPKNRFVMARDTLDAFVNNRSEDRIGLVVFGEEAFLKFPLTLDYARILAILRDLVLDSGERDQRTGQCTNDCTISGAGTAIGDAIARAYQRLRSSKAKSRIIVLITDGKNEGGKIQPKTIVDYIAARPEREQVRIYTFLVGNDQETYIPDRDMFGNRVYRAPSRPFPTDPELLRYIAEETGGRFYESYNEQKFRADWKDLERSTFTTETHTQHKDVFFPFVLAAGCLLAFELLLRFTLFRKFP
jgi:Ca-activated chloride channel family protein